MKTRIKNWITSIFGVIFLIMAVTMLVLNRFEVLEFSYLEMIMTAVFGWVFLMAKNSLIEGLFMGLFKVKNRE